MLHNLYLSRRLTRVGSFTCTHEGKAKPLGNPTNGKPTIVGARPLDAWRHATERKHQTRHGHVASMINSMKHSPLAFGRTRWHRSIVSSDTTSPRAASSLEAPTAPRTKLHSTWIHLRTHVECATQTLEHATCAPAPSVSVACPLNSSADDDPGIQVVGIGGDHVNDRIRL